MYKFVITQAKDVESIMNDGEKEGYSVVSTCCKGNYLSPSSAIIYITFWKKGK